MRAAAIGILVTVLAAACVPQRAPRPASVPAGSAGTPEATDRLFGERMMPVASPAVVPS